MMDGFVGKIKTLTALEYLQGIYRDPLEDPAVRRRAAIACLPFEVPKLVAVANVGNLGFGDRLEKAREAKRRLDEARAAGQVLELVRRAVEEA